MKVAKGMVGVSTLLQEYHLGNGHKEHFIRYCRRHKFQVENHGRYQLVSKRSKELIPGFIVLAKKNAARPGGIGLQRKKEGKSAVHSPIPTIKGFASYLSRIEGKVDRLLTIWE